jgi:hypothetical protein
MRWKDKYIVGTAAMVAGCQGFGGVRLTEVVTASGKPSNVATVVTVTEKGEPVVALRASSFKLSEDEQPLDPKAVDLRLLDPAQAVAFHTVLLLDLGYGTTEERRAQLNEAVAEFVGGVRASQSVTVIGFDGSSKSRLMGEFRRGADSSGIFSLSGLATASADPSRNLRGAVIDGLDALDAHLGKLGRPNRMGTLVVFARGPDVAGRVSSGDLDARLSASKSQLVFVGMAGDAGDDQTSRLSRDGRIEAQNEGELTAAFTQAAARVSALAGKYYLLSYCSPSRANWRRLRVEVDVVDDNLETSSSAFDARFDASQFTSGCASTRLPRFAPEK